MVWLQPQNSKTLAPWKKSCDKPRQYINKQKRYFANKGLSSQSYAFSCSHVWMWELHHKALKNWCFWTVVLEKTLESLLDCKEIKAVNLKGNQSWIFRTDAEAPILWPPDVKNWLIWKDPDAGKDWRKEKKEMIEDKMVGWHQWLDGHEFEPALGVGEGQGSLACCSPWGFRVRHDGATEQQYAELKVLKMSMCYILFTRKCQSLKCISEVYHRVITYFLILSLDSVKISALCHKWLYLSVH